MTCLAHAAVDPCPYCEWAATGNPTQVVAAARRADRVAGRPPSTSRQTGSPRKNQAETAKTAAAGASPSTRAARPWERCPARFKLEPG